MCLKNVLLKRNVHSKTVHRSSVSGSLDFHKLSVFLCLLTRMPLSSAESWPFQRKTSELAALPDGSCQVLMACRRCRSPASKFREGDQRVWRGWGWGRPCSELGGAGRRPFPFGLRDNQPQGAQAFSSSVWPPHEATILPVEAPLAFLVSRWQGWGGCLRRCRGPRKGHRTSVCPTPTAMRGLLRRRHQR